MCKYNILLKKNSWPNHILLLSVLIIFPAQILFASSATSDKGQQKSEGSSLPHCGLYCVYTLAKIWSSDVEFKELLKPKYISSYEGSTLNELKQAAIDQKLHAECIGNMTIHSLKNCKKPVILHVKSTMESKNYDHFMLFLGLQGNKARVFAPPQALTTIPMHELSYLWDGNALVVSKNSINIDKVILSEKKRVFFCLGAIGVIVAGFHGLKRFAPTANSLRLRFGLSIGQAVSFVMIAVFAGLLFHYFYGGGFFGNAAAIEGIQEAYAGSFVPKVTPGRMQRIVARNDAVIVDARLEQDYESGHISGAINLPINCSDEMYAKTVSGLTKDQKVVLYCQSAGCPFAEKIALRLKEDGFGNLEIFKGGWVEWQKATEAQSAQSEDQKSEKSV